MERSCYMTQQRRKYIQYSSESRVQHSRVTVHFHPPTSLFKWRVYKINSFTFRCHEFINRKISATTNLQKNCWFGDFWRKNSFTIRCHVINDRALGKENFAAESENWRKKSFIIRCHMTPTRKMRTCAVKGEIIAITAFTCCLAWGSGGWQTLLAISSCCSTRGCRSGGFLSLVIFSSLVQQANKSTNTTTT